MLKNHLKIFWRHVTRQPLYAFINITGLAVGMAACLLILLYIQDENSYEEMCLFSTDYPHVEGGRNPLKRFGESVNELPESVQDAFYAGNFIDMMGEGLAPDLRRPEHLA